jgi:hypothetical protein
MSVGDKIVKINTEANNTVSVLLKGTLAIHMATPVTAIIKVGDSALWLNITNQMSMEAIVNIL